MTIWIKCSDRMPDPRKDDKWTSERVLIWDGKYVGMGFYEFEYFIEDDPEAYEGQKEIYSSEGWCPDQEYMDDLSITHWAKMPEPPNVLGLTDSQLTTVCARLSDALLNLDTLNWCDPTTRFRVDEILSYIKNDGFVCMKEENDK